MGKKGKPSKKSGKNKLSIKMSDLPAKSASSVKGGKTRITLT